MTHFRKALNLVALIITGSFLCFFNPISLAVENPAEPQFLKGKENAVWVTLRNAPVYSSESNKIIVKRAKLGEPLEVVGVEQSSLKVVDSQGKNGWLEKRCADSHWILVSKKEQKLFFFEKRKLLGTWGADFGPNPQGDKEREGDGKTPEGELYVCSKLPRSMFYKAFLLSYPSVHHGLCPTLWGKFGFFL